jgi:hypothetical protein
MKIRDYTVPELNHFRTYCNFSPVEAEFFELRAADSTLEDCCEAMNLSMSAVNSLSKRVKTKISRV